MVVNKQIPLNDLEKRERMSLPPPLLIARVKEEIRAGQYWIAYHHWLIFLTNGRKDLFPKEVKEVTALVEQCIQTLTLAPTEDTSPDSHCAHHSSPHTE